MERREEVCTALSRAARTTFPVFKNIDDVLGGWMRKELVCVMGPPAMGKSIFLVNWGFKALIKGYNVAHYSFEMSQARLQMRYDSIVSKTPQKKLIESKDKVAAAYVKVRTISKGHVKVKEFPTASATVMDIEADLEELRIRGFIPDIVIVDYGDIMRSTRVCKNPYEEQGWIFRELRALAIKRNIAVITGTQTRRDALNKNGGTNENVGMDQVADSMEKNRVIDYLFSIIQTKGQKENNKISLSVVKNRNGPQGMLLDYDIDYPLMTIGEVGADITEEMKEAILRQKKESGSSAKGGGTVPNESVREVISVFIALCAAVILDSASLPCTSPAVWDPEPAFAA